MTHSVRTTDPENTDRPGPAAEGWPVADGPLCPGGGSTADVDMIRVCGGTRLVGTVPVVGAKNSALKLMAAALLAPGRTVITNVPRITDIAIMGEVLRRLGCQVSFGPDQPVDRAAGRPGAASDEATVADQPARSRAGTSDVPDSPGTEADY
ncbi:MAG TPA: UDP-N-acetylglucosamine 1-carboxyvinyltransferase, partial [Micromonospora sp.]